MGARASQEVTATIQVRSDAGLGQAGDEVMGAERCDQILDTFWR